MSASLSVFLGQDTLHQALQHCKSPWILSKIRLQHRVCRGCDDSDNDGDGNCNDVFDNCGGGPEARLRV